LGQRCPADGLTPADGKDWIWQKDRVRALLSAPHESVLFISGCAENMHRLYPLIDRIILLSAPIDTIMARLEKRSTDGYGHTTEERAKVAALIAGIEPLLRRIMRSTRAGPPARRSTTSCISSNSS